MKFRKLKPPVDPYAAYTLFDPETHVCCNGCGKDFQYAESTHVYAMGGTQSRILCYYCQAPEEMFFDIHKSCSVSWFNHWRSSNFSNYELLPEDSPCPVCGFQDDIIYPTGNNLFLWTQFKPVPEEEDREDPVMVADFYTFGTKKLGEYVSCIRCFNRYRVDYLHVNSNCTVICPNSVSGCDGNLLHLYKVDPGTAKVIALRMSKVDSIPPYERRGWRIRYPWDRIRGRFDTVDLLVRAYGGWDIFIGTYMFIVKMLRKSSMSSSESEYF